MSDNSLITTLAMKPDTTGFAFSGEGLDIDIKAGEIVSIIGPDYTGKSQWLSTLAGVHAPHSGSVSLLGKETEHFIRDDWINARRQLAYVRSDTAILSAANAIQNVILPGRYHRIDSAKNLMKIAIELLEEIGVTDQTSLPAYLRAEQRYKIAIARALILRPDALVLDSPFERLDALAMERLQGFLLERVKQDNMALVMVTHNINFAIEQSDQLLFVTHDKMHHFDSDEEIRRCDINDITSFLNKNRVTC